MLFIDGSWLYRCRVILRQEVADPHYVIDYKKLPRVLVAKAREALSITDADLVRTFFFASIPENYDARDTDEVARRREFYDMLKEEFHFETEILPIDFRRRRVRREDRELSDSFTPEEKRADVALACAMLYYAAAPSAYDVAVPVIGDDDYVPALQYVRRLGKRVVVASVRGSCSDAYTDPVDTLRVRDGDTMFLNDLLEDLRLEYTLVTVQCESPEHIGARTFQTRYRPRPGERVYCEDCRNRFSQHRAEAEAELNQPLPTDVVEMAEPGFIVGRIANIITERGFGFIRSEDGRTYFFHMTALRGLNFQELHERQIVQFRPTEEPGAHNRNRGNTHDVRPVPYERQEEPAATPWPLQQSSGLVGHP
jgi:cold shock CspA family protein/uncharacterized LabA/DUF88 family protein